MLFDDLIERPTYPQYCPWGVLFVAIVRKSSNESMKRDDRKIEPKSNTARPSLHLHVCRTDLLMYMISTYCADFALFLVL